MAEKLTQTDIAVVQAAIDQQYEGDPAVNIGYTDILGSTDSARGLDGKQLTTVAYDYGVGGVTFAANKMAIGNIAYLTYQSPHEMKLMTVLEQHLHFCTKADETGKSIRFLLNAVGAGVWGQYVSVATNVNVEYTIAAHNEIDPGAGKHWLMELANTTAVNSTVSSIWKIRLERMTPAGTDLADDLYIDFIDGHIQIDQERGSREEYVK